MERVCSNFPTPDLSTIHRRLKYELKNDKTAGNMLIMDSTGFRLMRRKKWIKLHIITDGKKIVRFIITKNSVGDSPAFREMFRTLKNELKDVDVLLADSAYDSRDNFNLISQYGLKPLIKVRKNSSTLSKGSPSRRAAIREQRDANWSRKSGYTKRWLVESVFSSIKISFGESLSSRKFFLGSNFLF